MENPPVLTSIDARKEERRRVWRARRRALPDWTLLLIPAAILLLVHWWEGPFYYYGPAIRARVVDEQTGQPVAGAVVVAQWRLHLLGDPGYSNLHEAETVTDANGEFSLPKWGPKLRPPLTRLMYKDPGVLVYKPGYQLGGASNARAYVAVFSRPGDRRGERPLPDGRILQVGKGGYSRRKAKRFCYWNGKEIPLTPATSVKEEANAIETMVTLIDSYSDQSHFPTANAILWQGAMRIPFGTEERRWLSVRGRDAKGEVINVD